MQVPIQKLRDVSEGIIQPVDNSIIPANSVYLSINFKFDKVLGRAVLRDGTTVLGSQLVSGKTCLGLYQHITSAGTKIPLAVFNDATNTNSDVFKYASSTWTKVKEDITASANMRFATLLGTTMGINGTDEISTADGTTWVTTGGNLDIGNCPAGTIVKEWKDKIYVAGVSSNRDRLYYSSVPTGGAISWTSGNGYIDIEPDDSGGGIVGLAKVPGYLLIFKKRSLKRWDSSSTYPDDLINLGAYSQEGIVETKQACYFFNKRGVYETTGGYPRKISKRIDDIINAIPSTFYSSVAGWGDGENVYFSIGDITLGDLAISNCVIAYNIDSQSWTLHSFANEFRKWTTYVDSNENEILLAGDTTGYVFQIFSGNTDGESSKPINYLLQWNEQEFGSRGKLKDISNFILYSKDIRSGTLTCRIDGTGNFVHIGGVYRNEQEFNKEIHGRQFEFRVQGQGKSAQVIGMDFPSINVSLNYNE